MHVIRRDDVIKGAFSHHSTLRPILASGLTPLISSSFRAGTLHFVSFPFLAPCFMAGKVRVFHPTPNIRCLYGKIY